jgi:hypothetical protein
MQGTYLGSIGIMILSSEGVESRILIRPGTALDDTIHVEVNGKRESRLNVDVCIGESTNSSATLKIDQNGQFISVNTQHLSFIIANSDR